MKGLYSMEAGVPVRWCT